MTTSHSDLLTSPGVQRRAHGGERGSATVWMVALMALVWVVAAAVVQMGAVRVARHRAQSAADLGALAAAPAAFTAPTESCGRAKAVIAANDARITSCSVTGGNVDLSVLVHISLPMFGIRDVMAQARAGPVGAEDRCCGALKSAT